MSSAPTRRSALALGRGEDPILYSLRLYVQYLQGLFNFMPKGSFYWDPDKELSEIVIRAQAPLDLKTVGKRPAITVVMGPYNFSNIGIDNLLSYNPKTGVRMRTDLISGHLVVYCLANSDILAMRLSHLVAHHTRVNQRLLESEGGFHSIARPAPQVNSPSPPGQLVMGDPGQLIMTQVNIPFQTQWTWETTPKQSAQLRSLNMITQNRRASEVEYQEPTQVESITLAMSTSAVRVRRLNNRSVITQNDGLPTNSKPSEVTIHDGITDFQTSGLESFQEN